MTENVTIAMPIEAARATLQAVEEDEDRSKWGHHQWLRIKAEAAIRMALAEKGEADA